jgi:hypothetical protein
MLHGEERIKKLLQELIEFTNGEYKSYELDRIIIEAEDKYQISEKKIKDEYLPAIMKTINWPAVQEAYNKRLAEEAEKEKQEAENKRVAEEQRQMEENVRQKKQLAETINVCLADETLKIKETLLIFQRGRELGLTDTEIVMEINEAIAEHRLIAQQEKKGSNDIERLLSTDWAKTPPLPKPPPQSQPKPQSQPQSKPQPQPKSQPPASPSGKKSSASKWVGIVVVLLLALGAGWYFWYRPMMREKNATYYYNITTSLALRKYKDIEGEELAALAYGDKVKQYREDSAKHGDWVKCKFNDKEGYVYARYLMNEQEFTELNSIFATSSAIELAKESHCKRALYDYFKKNNFIGDMSVAQQEQYYGFVRGSSSVWQLFPASPNSRYNTVLYGRWSSSNNKKRDMACIIQNKATGERRFLLFSFDDYGTATLLADQSAPRYGNIREVGIYSSGNVWARIE